MSKAPKNNLQIYADMIDKGEIVVCEYLAREIENLIRDLSNPLFVYDTKDAERRFEFQQKFCLQSKAPYYNKPVVLMPWQKAFFILSLKSIRFYDILKIFIHTKSPNKNHSSARPISAINRSLLRQSSLTFIHVCKNTLQSKNLSISCRA